MQPYGKIITLHYNSTLKESPFPLFLGLLAFKFQYKNRMVRSSSRLPFLALKRVLYLTLWLLTSYLLFCSAGELRFCYHGPQRILYKDCPGGFVARNIVKASCMYYYKADAVPNMETYLSENVCEQDSNLHQLDPDFQDFTGAHDFQLITFDADNSSGITDGSDPAYEKCNQTCLAEWVEPKYWDSTKIFIDKDELNDTVKEEYRKEYTEITKLILIKIINEDEFDEDLSFNSSEVHRLDFLMENTTILTQPMTSLMRLLAKSMRVIHKRCSPFIETSFYTLVFRAMIEFRRMNDNFPDMNVLPLKRIMKILDQCEREKEPYFVINGTTCQDKYVAQTITDLKNNLTMPHRLEPISFRWGRYDPIIEAAWSAVQFVHAYCFDYFIKDMLHYSLYVKGMNEIFVQPLVEKHWMYPFPVGKGMTLWEMAFDTSDIQNQLTNLDACVQGSYLGAVYGTRLDRPFNKQEFFEPPKYEVDNNVPTPGWTKSVEEYWRMYEKHGFQEMVDALGYCAPTLEAVRAKADEYADAGCFLSNNTSTSPSPGTPRKP